jgi:SAM-dependent methyltransferase
MYFDKLKLWNHIGGAAVLHIAPELHLAEKIQELRPRQYVKGDLVPNAPDIETLDVTAIRYADESFDFLICNHVLEHVPDDRKALSEFYRVLKPGARAVLQTPFSRLLTYSFCDPAINTDALRTRFYFQEDHVRLYGRDLFSRIEEAGLKVQTIQSNRTATVSGDRGVFTSRGLSINSAKIKGVTKRNSRLKRNITKALAIMQLDNTGAVNNGRHPKVSVLMMTYNRAKYVG